MTRQERIARINADLQELKSPKDFGEIYFPAAARIVGDVRKLAYQNESVPNYQDEPTHPAYCRVTWILEGEPVERVMHDATNCWAINQQKTMRASDPDAVAAWRTSWIRDGLVCPEIHIRQSTSLTPKLTMEYKLDVVRRRAPVIFVAMEAQLIEDEAILNQVYHALIA